MNLANAAFKTSVFDPVQLPFPDKKEIVFSGRSNVGKSSLINKLFNRKNLARVSSAPGKTASINFYECDHTCFVDLPGYGFAKVSRETKDRWAALVEGYFGGGRKIALVIQLIDARHSPSEFDLQMLSYLQQAELPFMIALTKCDKLKKSELSARKEDFASAFAPYGDNPAIFTSAESGEGIQELKNIIFRSI